MSIQHLNATSQAAAVDDMARRLVAEDVRYCVSGLVAALWTRDWHNSADGSGIDPDDLSSIAWRAPDVSDYQDATAYQSKFHVVVTEQDDDAGGRWHWAATGADGEPDEGRADTELEAWEEAFDFVGADRPDGTECLEHWLVTDDLARRLEAEGEAVARDVAGLTIWGRCTSGQAIYADAVMQRLARAILEA